jgi:osmotically-inducible protein OsmY
MSDYDTKRWVSEELYWDPKLDSKAIAVSADDGEVTLRGTVGSFHEKRDAEHAARRVTEVKAVNNHLKVRLLTKHGRDDADLRGAVLRALQLDSLIPNTIDASVADGWVTLTGRAACQYQREEAEYVAGNVPGVLGVGDEIRLENAPSDSDVAGAIRKAFTRNANIAADDLSVDTRDGTVVLSGTVSSWEEHDAAIAAAWSGPGVTEVHDHLEVYDRAR